MVLERQIAMNELSHRYAAVLAADVAHFSRFMERDGEATVSALQECRASFQRCISSNNGREFGCYGDSFMAEFASPIEALRAARACQTLQAKLGQSDDHNEPLRLRLGLHAGDVICDGNALLGDVINIAARLQSIAAPGEIVLSSFVYQQVHKEKGFDFSSLGKHHLKNIAEPVLVYRVDKSHSSSLRRIALAIDEYKPAVAAMLGVIVTGFGIIAYLEFRDPHLISKTTIAVPTANSIAVLPFEVCEDSIRDTLLAGSLSEEIHSRLVQRWPNVIAKSQASVKAVVETGAHLDETAKLLGVQNLLRGELCRDESDSLTIRVEVINDIGFTMWRGEYRQLANSADQIQRQFASQIDRNVATSLGDVNTGPSDRPPSW
jgi:class 3 adenylate cyclase/TolB-like protein